MTVTKTSGNRSFWVAACVAACALAQPLASTVAQPAADGAAPDEARTVAAAVQAFYDQTTDVSADFYQTYVHKLYNRTDRSKGKVVFKKPGKMRWNYARPNGKVIVSDGTSLTIYEPGEEGEAGQVIDKPITQDQLPQAMAFLMGTGKLQDDFTFRLLDAKKHGYAHGHVLELKPREPTPHYTRLLFYVEKKPALRGLVRRLLIIDEAGNRNRFDFSHIKFNTGVGNDTFQWKPPAGTRRVKM
jgi:outer membrane lipoprotein carrier protein